MSKWVVNIPLDCMERCESVRVIHITALQVVAFEYILPAYRGRTTFVPHRNIARKFKWKPIFFSLPLRRIRLMKMPCVNGGVRRS